MELQAISSATVATTTSYLLHCRHRAASLAVPYQHCRLPKGQIPASVSCSSLCCRMPPFLRYLRNAEKWFGYCCYYVPLSCSLPYDLPCVAFSSSVSVQQLFEVTVPTTVPAAGDHRDPLWAPFSGWGAAVVCWWHLPRMRYLWCSSASIVLKSQTASYLRPHPCLHYKE